MSNGARVKVDTDPKDSGRLRSNKKQVKLVLSPRGIRVHDKQPEHITMQSDVLARSL